MSRRRAREMIITLLYQVDLVQANPWEAMQDLEMNDVDRDDLEYVRRSLKGTLDNLDAIDEQISHWSKDWSLERLAAVDKAILRLGVYEIMAGEVHPAVAIDEAVEMAKKFGEARSSAFVNAILDRVREART